MSASPVRNHAEGIKITLSAPKSVTEGQAGEAVRGWSWEERGGEKRDEIAESSGMQGR